MSSETQSTNSNVIKPWLGFILIAAIAANAILTGFLLIKLTDFSSLEAGAATAKAALAKASSELESKRVEIDTLERKRNELQPAVDGWESLLKEKSEAAAFLETVEARKQQAESERAQADERLNAAKLKQQTAEKDLLSLQSKIADLRAEEASLTSKRNEAAISVQQVADYERRKAEAIAAIENTQRQQKQLDTDVAEAKSEYENWLSKAGSLRSENALLKSEAASLAKEIKASKESLLQSRAAEENLNRLQEEVLEQEQILAGLKVASAAAEARSIEAENRIQKATASFAGQTERLDQLKKSINSAEVDLESLLQSLAKSNQDLAGIQKLVAENHSLNGDLVTNQSRLQTASAEAQLRLESLQEDLGDLEGRKQVASADYRKLSSEIETAEREVGDLTARKEAYLTEIRELQAEIDTLRQTKADEKSATP